MVSSRILDLLRWSRHYSGYEMRGIKLLAQADRSQKLPITGMEMISGGTGGRDSKNSAGDVGFKLPGRRHPTDVEAVGYEFVIQG